MPIYVCPERKICGLVISKTELYFLSPNFHILVSVSDLYIRRIGLPILLKPNRQIGSGNIQIAHRYIIAGIGIEAAQFHFINWIYGTVHMY